ncbi:hypothetical protein [Actinomadura rugatobispora]|uniref:Uncharacterized protein n=1 Tax=Actinomadura rugatobispora TaxID=1994 RepID=A0ABW1A8M7_9ACTN|nr:hypothetical protein GCM10010200_084570 [Actinomadura rugatobispora]
MSAEAFLRERMLEAAAAAYPERPPVIVREWTDPVLLHGPEPVGHRALFLVATGADDRPAEPVVDAALNAFEAAGWPGHHWKAHPGEIRASATGDDFSVMVYAGQGAGMVTFTGWTPVVFTERDLRQPHFTASTVGGVGVVCEYCHGWTVCLECEGTARSRSRRGYGRCECAAANAGPGTCLECAGKGYRGPEDMAWKRKRYGLADPAETIDAFRQPPVEHGHDSNISALTEAAHRTCPCGEFRWWWRNIVTEADDHLVSQYLGTCQGCAAQRVHAFALPGRRLPALVPPATAPPCPQCAGTPIPLVGGLHFPGTPMMRAEEQGLVARLRTSSEVRPNDPNWRCTSCAHEWRDTDKRRREKFMRALHDDLS